MDTPITQPLYAKLFAITAAPALPYLVYCYYYLNKPVAMWFIILIIAVTFALIFCYFVDWISYDLKKQKRPAAPHKGQHQVIVLGDEHTDKEAFIESHFNLHSHLYPVTPTIIPAVLLKQDSPRNRQYLERLLTPYQQHKKRVIILVNITAYAEMSEAQQLLYVTNLNRIVHLIHSESADVVVDLAIANIDTYTGYAVFCAWLEKHNTTPIFNAQTPLNEQLAKCHNYSRAVTSLSSQNFLLLLEFFSCLERVLEPIEKLAVELLLSTAEAESQIYFITAQTRKKSAKQWEIANTPTSIPWIQPEVNPPVSLR